MSELLRKVGIELLWQLKKTWMLLVGIERQKISQFWQELAQIHNEEQIGTYLQKLSTKYEGQV